MLSQFPVERVARGPPDDLAELHEALHRRGDGAWFDVAGLGDVADAGDALVADELEDRLEVILEGRVNNLPTFSFL